MVKLIQCVTRRTGLGLDEFRAAWEAYGERLRRAAAELGAVRVTLSTTLETPLNDALAETRGSLQAFDGIAEIAWLSTASMNAGAARPGARERLAGVRAAQERFVDPGASTFFFAHEQALLDEAGGAGE